MIRDGQVIGSIGTARAGARVVRRPADRPDPLVRRPGGDRHRERAPLQRDPGGARAADRDGRDPARDQRIAGRHPARVPRHRRHGIPALRRRGRLPVPPRGRRLPGDVDRPPRQAPERAFRHARRARCRGELPLAGDARQADAAHPRLARGRAAAARTARPGRRRHPFGRDAADPDRRRVHRRPRGCAHAAGSVQRQGNRPDARPSSTRPPSRSRTRGCSRRRRRRSNGRPPPPRC